MESILDRLFGVPYRFAKEQREKKKEVEALRETDLEANYELDGVSYDGDQVIVSSDGRVPDPKRKDVESEREGLFQDKH